MKKLLLVLLLWLAGYANAFACSCGISYPFCHAINYLPHDLVVSGVIINSTDTINVELRVLQKFRGTDTRDTITVWAGNSGPYTSPSLCWHSLATHHLGQVGDTIIITLQRISPDTLHSPWDVVGDYRRLSDLCDYPHLKVINGVVTGRIKGSYDSGLPPWSVSSMPYADFLASWNNGQLDCPLVSAAPDELPRQLQLELSPNPAAQTVNVSLPAAAAPLQGRLCLFDALGRQVLARSFSGHRLELPVGERPQGVYMLQLQSEQGQLWRQKLVVAR